MSEIYIPTVQEGVYPSDGGWIEDGGTKATLVLEVPAFQHFINIPVPKFDYAWLYNQEMNAYIFCFRIQGMQQIEKAIIFHEEHAGLLIKDSNAYDIFDILITGQPIETVTENTKYLHFPNITINRNPAAGW